MMLFSFVFLLLHLLSPSALASTLCFHEWGGDDPSSDIIYLAAKSVEDEVPSVKIKRGNCQEKDTIISITYTRIWSRAAGYLMKRKNQCSILIYPKVDVTTQVEQKNPTPKDVVRAKILSEELRLIFLHELGHCLGLAHSKDPRDIMYTSVGYETQKSLLPLRRYYNQLRGRAK